MVEPICFATNDTSDCGTRPNLTRSSPICGACGVPPPAAAGMYQPPGMRIEFVGTPAGMALSVSVAEAPVVRRVDGDAVSQIVLNLIDNAVKYAADGKALDVWVAADGTVVVADRGPGVPKRDRERVFERFYRCDDSLAAKSSGSGLGLSIARRLAEGMGGSLVCTARESGGAEFRLNFGGDAK